MEETSAIRIIDAPFVTTVSPGDTPSIISTLSPSKDPVFTSFLS